MDGGKDRGSETEKENERAGEREREWERERERDSDTSANAAQSKRPAYARRHTGNGGESHLSHQQQQQQQQQQLQHRAKSQKRVVGSGAGRFHARVPSAKGPLHRSHSQTTAKLRSRASSPEPERPPLFANTHRRTTSDLKLTATAVALASPTELVALASHHADASALKNAAPSDLASKRNRSHADVGKRSKSAAHIKRSSSHKDVQKLRGAKNQVHFALGNDDNDDDGENEDEWVDASASASPYLSRRGSVMSGGESPAKPPSPTSNEPQSRSQSRPHTPTPQAAGHPASPTRQAAQRSGYITSRLLQRTPSHGAPPQMSTENVSVPPPSGPPSSSPTSQAGRGPPSLYGTPKTSTLGASGQEELVSRFVDTSGPSSGGHGESDSYFVSSHALAHRNGGDMRRPQSLSNLNQVSRDSASEEDESALAPRSRGRMHRAAPASQSRTQQKLNLQRASSSMEPAQAGPGVGAVGAGPLVGGADYDHRDPRIGRLLERTGMEYLVVRRYQNPIARSITRLSHLPGANKNRRIPRQNEAGGMAYDPSSLDLDGAGRLGLSQSLTNMVRSRPATPRRSTSIRTVGGRSSYHADQDQLQEHTSGSTYLDGNDTGLSVLLRNLWDKSTDLSASQE
ncbi:hypothetical protein F4777DRAFT_588678 [Nemania sp. FL0916]|nr:hypothetical protein F4777DRAFT_588678 [Nemania sp. FL0916]